MPLVPVRNLLISMAPLEEELTTCDDRNVCAVFQKGDPLLTQMIQTPCEDNLVCNGDMAVDDSIITNGDFATDLSGWTASGFAWAAGTARTTTDGDLSQTGLVIAPSSTYSISYTVTENNATGDTLEFILGGSISTFGPTSVGTHQVTIVAGGVDSDFLMFYTIDDGTGFNIDDISINKVDCWMAEAGWTFNGEAAIHTPGSINFLREDIYSSLSAGDYVVVTYSVFNMSDGTLEVKVGGTVSRTVTENGTYTDYIITALSDDYLTFTPDTDFDGAVTVDSSYKLLNTTELTSIAGIFDSDDTLIQAITPAINDEYITIGFGSNVAEGCYTIKVLDPCSENTNPELVANGQFLGNPSGWSWLSGESDSPQTIIAENGHLIYTSDGSGTGNNIQTMQSPQGVDYGWSGMSCENEYILITGEVDASFNDASVQVLLDGFGLGFDGFTGPFESNKVYKKLVATTMDPTDGIVKIRIDGGTSTIGQTFEIMSISAKHKGFCEDRPNNVQPYESNCILIKDSVPDSLIIKGMPEDTDEHRTLGAYFWAGFPYVFMRVLGHWSNPRRPRKLNTDLYSSGLKRNTFIQLDKTFDFIIEGGTTGGINSDQIGYDALAMILSLDHVHIHTDLTTISTTPEYIWEEKELSPSWVKGVPVAECTIEISRIDKTVFN